MGVQDASSCNNLPYSYGLCPLENKKGLPAFKHCHI